MKDLRSQMAGFNHPARPLPQFNSDLALIFRPRMTNHFTGNDSGYCHTTQRSDPLILDERPGVRLLAHVTGRSSESPGSRNCLKSHHGISVLRTTCGLDPRKSCTDL